MPEVTKLSREWDDHTDMAVVRYWYVVKLTLVASGQE
jgi:hypothetical protein